MKCPPFADTMIISDDAGLAARLAPLFARRGHYLAIIEGPRLQRHDADNEIIERANAVQRVGPKRLVLVGLSSEAVASLERRLPREMQFVVMTGAQVDEVLATAPSAGARALERPGLAMLEAMRGGLVARFGDGAGPAPNVASISGHIVVCEAGHAMAEVIAASYAYALGASLIVVPETEQGAAEDLLEAFYGIYDHRTASTSERFAQLCALIRARCPGLDPPSGSSCTFISNLLPLGVGFPEIPSTHLFAYPSLGAAVINGIAAEQPRTAGVNIVALVDPQTTEAPEIDRAAQ